MRGEEIITTRKEHAMTYDKNLLNHEHASSDLIPKQIYKETPFTIDNIRQINQKFMGGGMSQNYFAIPWFEYYFDTHNFEYIVELGSQKGCLSTYFANFAGITEQCFFETYEINPDKDWNTRKFEGCGHWFKKLADMSPFVNYFHQDVFSNKTISHISENISQFKTFIFCDGGDKVEEFKTYAPLLKTGDCIAVHDWGHEIHKAQIEQEIQNYGFTEDIPHSLSAVGLGTLIMPFRKES